MLKKDIKRLLSVPGHTYINIKDDSMNRSKLLKMFALIGAILLFVVCLRRFLLGDSLSLTEYAELHGTPDIPAPSDVPVPSPSESPTASPAQEDRPDDTFSSTLTGAVLNGDTQLEFRQALTDAFYYEPLSDDLRRYITGVSYPALPQDGQELSITLDELSYVHILHYDFDGNPAEGELICNSLIAQDLVEIFYELYRNEYRLERVRLIDGYDGDDTASMEDNNTSCFNYRTVEGSSSLSRHALGLAVDINPLYNPYITYNSDGSETVSPASGVSYADRSRSFPYKIDEDDLCYKLFTAHGFTWGGNWNSCKDYQHFQKAPQ